MAGGRGGAGNQKTQQRTHTERKLARRWDKLLLIDGGSGVGLLQVLSKQGIETLPVRAFRERRAVVLHLDLKNYTGLTRSLDMKT
jgi:hypothetical protein